MSNTMKNKFGKFLQELFSRGVDCLATVWGAWTDLSNGLVEYSHMMRKISLWPIWILPIVQQNIIWFNIIQNIEITMAEHSLELAELAENNISCMWCCQAISMNSVD